MWKGVSNFLIADILHCVKSVQIRGFFWFVLSRIWTEYGYLLQSECGKIWTGKNSVNGYFSPSINRAIFSRKFVIYYFFLSFWCFQMLWLQLFDAGKTSWCMTWNAFSYSCSFVNIQKCLAVSDCICTNDLS